METLFNSRDKFRSHHVTVDGYKTHYIEAGKEEMDRVLLVHGGSASIGNGLYRWYPTVIPLSKHFHVHAIDELGHGETDPPRNLQELMFVRVRAEHVIDFIEELGLAPVHLVGQSQGGWIVTYITLKRPDLVKKLVLVDSGSTAGSGLKTAPGDPDEVVIDGVRMRAGSGELPYFKDLFEPGTRMPKEEHTTTREGIRKHAEAFFYNKAMVTEEYVDYLVECAKRWRELYKANRGKEFWSNKTVKEYNEMYYIDGVHIRDLVKDIKTPTLVIWGRNSNKGIDPGIELYKRIPGAQMHIFDRANHFLWLDQWKDFNSLVTWFLKEA